MVTDHHHQDKRCLREMRHVLGIVLGGGITILETPRGWIKKNFVFFPSHCSPGNVSPSELAKRWRTQVRHHHLDWLWQTQDSKVRRRDSLIVDLDVGNYPPVVATNFILSYDVQDDMAWL
jgi:hypothetical protein